MKKRVLITGATGLIGFHVAILLANCEGFQPVCIVRERGYSKNKIEYLKRKGVLIWSGCFLDQENLNSLFSSHSIRFVVHLAALRGGGAGTKREYDTINVWGTEILLRESLRHGVEKFIFCSSVGVFGTIPEEIPATIKTVLNGDNLYHCSKIKAEALVKRYSGEGLKTYIVRPTITYGKENNGFPSTLIQLVRKRRLILSRKSVKIHLLDADTFAEMIHGILSTDVIKNNLFIAADREPVLLKDLADRIHLYYHGCTYPAYLKMPGMFFSVAAFFFRIIRNDKWLTRILLISNSWYYDLGATFDAGIDFSPGKTENRLILKMCKGGDWKL